MKIGRRSFLRQTTLSTAAISLAGPVAALGSEKKRVVSAYDIMEEMRKYRKFDAHAHVGMNRSHPDDAARQIDENDRLGIEWASISYPVLSREAPYRPEEARENNDVIYKAMKRFPNRFIGFFTLNPHFPKESLEEIKRCTDLGFRGYKGYLQVKINDPLYFPIIEKLIDLKMICLMHAECEIGVGGHRMKYDIGEKAFATISEDMIEAARRYPEAIFQWAHIGGGGDWEYMCKSFADIPNIYVDCSGSNNEEGIIDGAIRILGEDRIFFGTDNMFYQGVGKILASNTSEAQKRKLFFDNYNQMLRKGGYHVA
jgi:predicted TIM-barrel fold metal-dependent hydrolase